jgi:hypothetical protein
MVDGVSVRAVQDAPLSLAQSERTMTRTQQAPSPVSADTTTKAEAAKVFKREARRILKQWAQDNPELVPHPAFQHHLVSARDRMRVRTYKLYRRVKAKGFEPVFLDLVLKLKVRHHIRDRDKPVRLALLLMAHWDKELTSHKWARQRRNELGDQIEYADRHNVPWSYFLGFITEAGGARSISRLLETPPTVDHSTESELNAIGDQRPGSEDASAKNADPVPDTPKRKGEARSAATARNTRSQPERGPIKGPGAARGKKKRSPPREPELRKPYFAQED